MKNDKGGQMKDLDFDELHEAVNKLMVQAQKPKAKREPVKTVAKAVTRPSVKVAERSAKDEKSEKPVEETRPTPAEDDTTSVNVTVRNKPTVKVLPKKRGMAMDVVQAAKASTVAPPSARAARTAPTLQPSGPVTPEAPKPRETAIPAPPEVAREEEPQDVSEDMLASINMQTDGDANQPKTLLDDDKPAASAFPDPLEVHGFAGGESKGDEPQPDERKAMEHTAPVIKPDPLLDDEPTEPAKPQWEMPAEEPKDEPIAPVLTPEPELQDTVAPAAPDELPSTPFLNTKVEKRPLGSYADATPPAQPVKPEEQKSAPVSEEKTEPATIDVPAAPAELRPEIVAVESADVDYSQPSDEPKKDGEQLGNLRQMAIPQQYHAHDKEPSKDERPVFDTKNYHPPLQPVATAKHHTGSRAGALLTIILIILLVAAGVVAYFIATGSIDIANLL